MRYKLQRLTELVGEVVLRPYVPHGTKWVGEGEGDWAPPNTEYIFFRLAVNIKS